MRQMILLMTLTFAIGLALPNQRPVIGIYTQSTGSDQPSLKGVKGFQDHLNESYVAASYVKYIQMSGAQVIPIFAYSNRSYFQDLLPKINGVLFPGGDSQIDITNKWTQNADFILKYAMNENSNGNVFPVWGTCLGMQLLAYLTSGYDAKAIAPVRGQVATRNTLNIQPQNTLFKGLSASMTQKLEYGDGILYFNHHYAVTKQYYMGNSELRKYWNVEAYTTTSFNQDFLSVFKAKNYPIFGVQFHPEKNLYQWKVNAVRSDEGAQIVQILSNKFIEYARLGSNSFQTNDEFLKLSIYNYKMKIPTTMSFISIYIFNEDSSQNKIKAGHLQKQKYE